MGMRITTNMMMNTYRYNLQQTTGNLSDATDKVLTKRKFNSYAEDPASATHAWRVRRSLTMNAGYQSSNTDTYTRFNAGWITMKSVDEKLLNGDGGAFAAIKRADNDPTGGARTALGKVLSNLADSVVFSMNGAKYGDHFIFAGNDEMNAPFSWDGNKLLYRGVNVNAGQIKAPDTAPPNWGEMIPQGTPQSTDKGLTALERAWVDYYRNDGLNPLNHKPDWVNDYEQYQKDMASYVPVEGKDPPTVPALPDDMTALDDAWLAWLQAEDGTPAKDETNPASTDNIPDWADVGGKPVGMVPEFMPEKREMVTTDWERAWYDYYTDQAKLADDDPANDPADPALDPRTVDPEKEFGWYAAYKADPLNAELPKDTDLPTTTDPKLEGLERAWLEYAYDHRDAMKLEIMAKEEKNIDLGMGLQEETNDRDLIQSTAFNRALPGINMLGYGVDADGDPKNIATIMKRLAELYSHCDEETGEFASDAEREEVYRLLDKFGQAHNEFNKAYSEVDTKSEFLLSNGERLKDQGYNLKEQIADIEQVDMADAIQDMSWSYYCYNAALKIGTQLLNQSLIDYMR